jgi:hypothetical protein
VLSSFFPFAIDLVANQAGKADLRIDFRVVRVAPFVLAAAIVADVIGTHELQGKRDFLVAK